jgi:hypothetical protein
MKTILVQVQIGIGATRPSRPDIGRVGRLSTIPIPIGTLRTLADGFFPHCLDSRTRRTAWTPIHYSYSYVDKFKRAFMNTTTSKPNTLPASNHPGFAKLKSQPSVFRCKLWPETNKKKPEHSDYHGLLQLSNGAKASILLWVHADGSLGLRLELITKE